MTQKQMSSMGGKARAKKLSKEHRKKIAREASMARWRKERNPDAPTPGAFGGVPVFKTNNP